MLSQLMALSETWKYFAAVVEIDENVSHYVMVSTWLQHSEVRGKMPYVPADDDVQQHQLRQPPESTFMDLVGLSCSCG